ncbi:MAG TPA: carboxypeptidase-like regulatory domain-containing protein [Candidatus Polarisedimenticolia bacterium]|nr:carboxypeptidase-like regulatory domain-containing protein [Candidatus Polarisedimenticolia bacterium]
MSRSSRRLVAAIQAALLLATALPALSVPAQAADKKSEATTPAPAGLGAIRGVIYRDDDTTRLMGATVTAINVKTGRRYTSNFTGENGAYEVIGIPAGTYDIAIDSGDKVYVTDNLVDLAESQRLYLSYSLGGGTPTVGDTPVFKGGAKLTFTDPNAIPTGAAAEKKSFWKRPGGIAIISVLVGGVVAAGVSAQQGD